MIKNLMFLVCLFSICSIFGQTGQLFGTVYEGVERVPYVNIFLEENQKGTSSDGNGEYIIDALEAGTYTVIASAIGYKALRYDVTIAAGQKVELDILLVPTAQALEETVVTGTLKAVNRINSPVPVEVYSPSFLKQNPTPNIFEALQNINGVRPQINCSVCNTGDIRINGLEGPYTLVLIDGMPIVSGLGTVYGLSGIPNSLIDQIEIVKGPASTLYGSEAVGGLINIITKKPFEAPEFFTESFASGWGEFNLDVGASFSIGKKTDVLFGANYFLYDNPIDNNGDNFTDLTLQDRISIFQKWKFKRNHSRLFALAARFFYEDRWGGELQWTPEFRGSDAIYGESIFTRRWEFIGNYQLPLKEKLMLSASYNDHNQNSVYGNVPYLADQRIGFAQFTWYKTIGKHDLLVGSALRYNFYDDDTPATQNASGNLVDEIWIPSVFVQDELTFNDEHSILGGMRYDHDNRHGAIFTPRAAYRWKFNDNEVLRLNAGTGFRVVNLFTEDHAALTGSREVVIAEELNPERSFNLNLNYLKKVYADSGLFVGIDASVFYTSFSNQIIPDYDTNPNQIIYDNLNGESVSQGISANVDMVFPNGLKFLVGATLQDVSNTENGERQQQILTERYMATWNVSYTFRNLNLTLDYTGNLYGPMRLPLLGDLDPRSEFSPTWSIQNIQFTFKGLKDFEVFGGVKNLLDWTPNNGNPFIIARANDPFDTQVQFNETANALTVQLPDNAGSYQVAPGGVIPTAENPYALTFDANYAYGPNQGIRGFLGLRYTVF